MMRKPLSATLVWVTLAASLVAQDNPKAEFDKLDAQLKQHDEALKELRQKYAQAADPDKPKVLREFQGRAEQRNALLPRLLDAAVLAFKAEPNKDEKVAQVAPMAVAYHLEQDDSDRALKTAQELLAAGHTGKQLHEMAGTAAFNSDRIDLAEEHLKKAQEAGPLGERGQKLLEGIGKEKQAWAAEQTIRAAESKADDLPRVKLQTTAGTMVIELYENQAPNTVANFIHLVEKGFYDGLVFHRVIGSFMAQGGDPTGTGRGGPEWAIACECYREDYRRHFRGTLSMAHAGKDTGGSQFFLTFVPTPHLDGRHTAFGRVIEGLDVLPKIVRRDPGDTIAPTQITKATVIRKRDHAYEPKKLPGRR